jgi:TPR repeat protein
MNLSYKRIIIIDLLLGITVVFSGCSNPHANSPVTNASLALSQEQIGSFATLAEQGDGEAAFKLSEYYAFWKFDQKASLKWLSIAATNGNVSGEYNLAHYYSTKGNRNASDTASARYWYSKAAATGDAAAAARLREIDQK